jgi:hypothetical protein
MRKFLAATAAVGAIGASVPALALAADPHNINPTGQPGQTCQGQPPAISPTNAFAPGNASSSPGSVFNEPNTPPLNSPTGGKGGQQYNLVGAPSQYDVACFQQSMRP